MGVVRVPGRGSGRRVGMCGASGSVDISNVEKVIVTPIAHGLDLLKSDLIRSPGVHASDIFGDLFKKLEPKRYDYAAM